jgi:nucleoside-diphosphate-sugar epimerase
MLSHAHEKPAPPQRAVVIGAGGFVGSAILKEIKKANIPALGITRKEAHLLSSGGSDALKALLRPGDAVVFVSAVAPAKNAAQVMTNLKMAEAAIAAFAAVPPAHLIYISSDAVYADDANPVTERSPVAPSTTHGLMHAARELLFHGEYKGPFAILRPTLIYGAGDPHSGYGPNRFRKLATKGEPIGLFGEGEEKRDHVAVEDVARLALCILLHGSSGVLNAVTGTSTSFHDIARIVAAQFTPAARIELVRRPGPRPHLLHRFFDITDCYKSFPDFHFEMLEAGLKRVHGEVQTIS